jgi:hypothetical protein
LGVAGAGIIFGIIRPLVYHRSSAVKTLAAGAYPIPSVALVPAKNGFGIGAVQLLYTWQF